MIPETELKGLKPLPDMEKRKRLISGKLHKHSTKVRLSKTQRQHHGDHVGMGGRH